MLKVVCSTFKRISKFDTFPLVNNVGKQYSYPMYLGEVPLQELWDIVNINIGATTVMTRMILPQICLLYTSRCV